MRIARKPPVPPPRRPRPPHPETPELTKVRVFPVVQDHPMTDPNRPMLARCIHAEKAVPNPQQDESRAAQAHAPPSPPQNVPEEPEHASILDRAILTRSVGVQPSLPVPCTDAIPPPRSRTAPLPRPSPHRLHELAHPLRPARHLLPPQRPMAAPPPLRRRPGRRQTLRRNRLGPDARNRLAQGLLQATRNLRQAPGPNPHHPRLHQRPDHPPW